MRPMLAATLTQVEDVKFPILGSPKLDGIRALNMNGVMVSRNLKPIPNEKVQRLFGKKTLHGLDGELIVGDPTDKDVYRRTNSGVMSFEGDPVVTFRVFDRFTEGGPFKNRISRATAFVKSFNKGAGLIPVYHTRIASPDALLKYEESMLELGFEGVMGRSLDGPYKHGRATMNEGYLWKMKRFSDSEAPIVGFEELLTNNNIQTRDALGRAQRSSHKANKASSGVLGAFVLRLPSGREFDVGSGFTADERAHFWEIRNQLKGRIVKYKYFPIGMKDKPRFPVYLGFRDPIDR